MSSPAVLPGILKIDVAFASGNANRIEPAGPEFYECITFMRAFRFFSSKRLRPWLHRTPNRGRWGVTKRIGRKTARVAKGREEGRFRHFPSHFPGFLAPLAPWRFASPSDFPQ